MNFNRVVEIGFNSLTLAKLILPLKSGQTVLNNLSLHKLLKLYIYVIINVNYIYLTIINL